ncbi:helix-turn-helix transcriptional regulator [Desulfoscipio gibsoniae]|uniref:Putative transcriptional regulator n=1 Tax=Desulfoscipio gibsoniae DSM 7213 TaxID=767817 RepID=R4KF10_9FIRM|nr:helix-turn-helix transcriptional regulator [Desulfoscipio gibsoniae]AGL00257.1 putative transcriptional regulator [Desulfoscipio gibsoniae DSM 7213]
MKSFSEKLKDARESLDMSQAELARKVGLSQRSITAYENENTIPRGNTIRKLARVLNVSIEYLMNDEETDPQANKDKDAFMDIVRENYGSKGAKEAEILLEQNKALFAGGDLSQEAKDAFFEALMVAYVTCKEEAKKTYGRKKKQTSV